MFRPDASRGRARPCETLRNLFEMEFWLLRTMDWTCTMDENETLSEAEILYAATFSVLYSLYGLALGRCSSPRTPSDT
jgi:hypothetical protein